MQLRKKEILISAAILSAAIAAGIGVGGALSYKQKASRQEDYRRSLEGALAESIKGIQVGLPLPDVILRVEQSGETVSLRELTSSGALILFIEPSCQDCLRAVSSFVAARAALPVVGEAADFMIAASARGIAEFRDSLSTRGVTLPLYIDGEQLLARDFGLSIFPLLLAVRSDGSLASIEPSGYSVEEYLALLRRT